MANADAANQPGEVADELIAVPAFGHDEPVGAAAALAGRDVGGLNRDIRGRVEVRYFMDNQRIVAPHLQCEDGAGTLDEVAGDGRPGRHAAGEKHAIDVWM